MERFVLRNFCREDKHAVFTKATQLAKTMYPDLRPDVEKISGILNAAGLDRSHYAKVVSNDTIEVHGALFAWSSDSAWAQRKHCQIMLWYCDVPGGCAALLRDFKRWVKSQRAIRVAGLYHDSTQMSPRALRLADRIGFKQQGGAYLLVN